MKSSFFQYLIARFTPGVFKPFISRFLYERLKNKYLLDAVKFKGKNVIVIGPARTTQEDLLELDSFDYDYVVRTNNALDAPLSINGVNSVRCDILFHSLSKKYTHVLTPEKINRAGVTTIVHRAPNWRSFLKTIVAERNFAFPQGGTAISIIPMERYSELEVMLDGYSPTTGFVCVDFFLGAQVKELAIVGFTFFTTKYLQGYDDRIKTDDTALDRVLSVRHHNPIKEAEVLQEKLFLAQKEGRVIRLGKSVKNALASINGS